MQESIRLGTFRGIPIGINWSLLIIAALLAAGLGAGRYPQAFPGYPTAAYLVAGGVTALLFFGSVLAHELGHALVATKRGIEVEGITLWLFGGVARLRSEAANPADELRIALVGPLVSVAAAGVFWVSSLLLAVLGAPDLAVGSLAWLGLINIVLAVFNLIPAAPLDGGRILRAILWRRSGDRSQAAVTAATAGRVLGFALVGLGILEFAVGAGLGGIWLMLIGWFIIAAARAEESHSRLRGTLGGMTVAEIMTRDVIVVPDWLTVDRLLDEYLLVHRCSTFPVRGFDGDLTGVVTLSAVKRLPTARRADTRVRDIACPIDRVPAVAPDEEVADMMLRMGQGCADGRVLVMDGDRLAGIVSPTDVARIAEFAQLGRLRREPHIS